MAGGLDHAIARSSDGGNTWRRDSLMPTIGYSAIIRRGSIMIMSGGQYMFSSSDSGLTWSPIDTLPQGINGMIQLSSGRIALVGSQGGSKGTSFFALSDQDGKNFDITVFDTVNGLFSITSLGGDSLVAPGRDGTFMLSADLGESWIRKNIGFSTVTHKIAYVNDTLMVAATGLGVLESYDRGNTWRKIEIPNLRRSQGADPNYFGVLDVEVAPSGLVYAAGGDFLFVRGMMPDTSAIAKVEASSRKNIYLRVMPYPNPATEGSAKVTILGAPTIIGVKRSLAIYDLLGRKVLDLSRQANSDLSNLSLEVGFSTQDLAKGTYLIVLDVDGNRISEQLLVH
jgi:hypothetical protein